MPTLDGPRIPRAGNDKNGIWESFEGRGGDLGEQEEELGVKMWGGDFLPFFLPFSLLFLPFPWFWGDFMSFWGYFLVILGDFGWIWDFLGTFGAFGGFWFNLG